MKLRIHREHWVVTIIVLLVWSVFMRFVFIVDLHSRHQRIEQLLLLQSRMLANNIRTTWLWNSFQGGVYVTQNDNIKPNIYLDENERTVTTENGDTLVKVSHDAMGRRIGSINNDVSFMRANILSRTPINPANRATDWDIVALRRFEQGEFEKGEEEIIDTPRKIEKNSELRYMVPMYATQSCLTCHDSQGYREGSLMGGLKITIQAESFYAWYKSGIVQVFWLFVGIWFIGFGGIVVTMSSISRRLHEQSLLNKFEGVLEMAGTAAHELNQPLQIISGYAELIPLLDCGDRDSLLEMLQEIRNNVARLSSITRKLNNITRYETIELSDSGRIVDLDRAASDIDPTPKPDMPADTP